MTYSQGSYPRAYPQQIGVSTTTATTTGYGQNIQIVSVPVPRKQAFSPSMVKYFKIVSSAQMSAGFMSIVLEAATIAQASDGIYILDGAGIAGGLWTIISGILGFVSAHLNQGPCMPITNIVMGVLTAITCMSQISVALLSLINDHIGDVGNTGRVVLGLQVILLLLAIAMFAMAIASTIMGGQGVCSPYTPPQSATQADTSGIATVATQPQTAQSMMVQQQSSSIAIPSYPQAVAPMELYPAATGYGVAPPAYEQKVGMY